MKKTRKKLTMAVGLAVGVTMLAGAALASYSTSNGYDIAKTAVKGLLKNENYNAKMGMKVSFDGETYVDLEMTELYDRDGDVVLNRTEKNQYLKDEHEPNTYLQYYQDNQEISVYNAGQSDEHAYVYTYNNIDDLNFFRGAFDVRNGESEESAKTTDKIIRFAELACDTLVGDLKNNVVYVSGDDNSATYEINLDAIQIPELVNAGISAMFSSMNNQEYSYVEEDPFLRLGDDPIVKNASMKFTVDNEGRLTDGILSAALSGNGHEAAMELSLSMSDYGITEPQRVDVSTLKNVEKHSSGEVEETNHVDEDGNVIDEDGNVVGDVEIDENGEGVVVYKD